MAEPLRFEDLRVRRMPGFEDEGFHLPQLSPGINVIHGPNGSGKTTTARAIEGLLWPRTAFPIRPSVSGRFRVGGTEWSVDLEVDRAVHRRGGMATEPPLLPPAEDRDRYRLSLHELLAADGSRFAEAIQREAAGGYDLSAARATLPARGSGSRQLKEVKALDQAQAELTEAVQAQRELRDREQDLGVLRARRESAAAAARRVETLRLAITHAAAREAEARARQALAQHPSGMETMRGDELERLAEVEGELAGLDDAIAGARKTIAAADEVIAGAVAAEVDRGMIAGLHEDLRALQEAERNVAAAERQREGAASRLEEERRAIGGAVREDVLADLDAKSARALADFARRAAEARARLRALESQLGALGGRVGPDELDDGGRRIADGIRVLRAWLRSGAEPSADAGFRRLAVVTGVILTISGIALGTVAQVALAFAALGAVVLVIALTRPRSGTDGRSVHRAEYERLDLDDPERWEPPFVERLLATLEDRHAAAAAESRRSEARRSLEPEVAEAREVVAAVDAERAALAERVGVEPATDEATLVGLIERVSRWQATRSTVVEADGALARAREQAEALGRSLRERLAPFAGEAPDGLGALTAAVQRLDDARQRRDDAQRDRTAAVSQLSGLTERRDRCRQSLRAIYERAGLEDGDADGLRRRCEAYAGYREARQLVDEKEVATREARARVLERGGHEDLLERPEAELSDTLAAAQAEAAHRDELDREINGTEEVVRRAKKLHDIESRLAKVDRLKDELRDVRERDARGAIAELLAEHVRREAREEQLPGVFLGARKLFSRITRGRYTLDLTDGPEPSFHAIDNLARVARSLDELSSGTRVQLLLAVRMAFVESREAEARLPLVLDEVLGNSDDERASAIMEAVVELAADGRQIFYFTAQSDEVHKWGATLASRERVPWLAIDLEDATRAARTIRIGDLRMAAPRGARVPAPGARSHPEYAEILGVPAVDPVTGHAGSLHLWYLIGDPEELYGLLRHGPERWGELEGLVRSTGTAVVDGGVYERAAALAVAADAWFDAVRIGAGRPIDRAGVIEAEGITPTFREPVDEVRERVRGDARLLLSAIEQGELKRFNKNKLAEFREYLCARGYIDSREPLEESEIRNRVLGSVSAGLERGLLDLADVDGLISRLTAGASR